MRNGLYCGVCASAVVLLAAPAYAQQASSDAETYNFHVAGGRLSQVVAEIASQARATVSLDGSAAADVAVSGVSGTYTLHDALAAVLTGTNWTVETGPNNTFRIVGAGDGAMVLPAVIVTGRRQDFARSNSSLLTRTDTPLQQTPGTIDSVTEEVLESQNAISAGEALRNIPGAIFIANSTASATLGQETTGGMTYTNGLQASRLSQNPPITDIEAIEVLKGPAAILVGSSITGGVINFVPKRATGRESYEAAVGFGSGDEYIISADMGGAIVPEYGLFWRVAALWQEADELPGGGNNPEQRVINPMIGWRADGWKVDATLQYYTKDTPTALSAAYIPATDSFVKYSANRLSPDSMSSVESTRLSYSLERDLVDTDAFSLTFRTRGLYQTAEQTYQLQLPFIYDFFGLGTLMLNQSEYGEDEQISAYADLYGKFSTGPVEHQVIVAYDLTDSDTAFSRGISDGFSDDTTPFPMAPVSTDTTTRTERTQNSFILQDQMKWGRFNALVSLRTTSYEEATYSRASVTDDWVRRPLVNAADKFLVNGGLVYDLTDAVSVYVSYSNAFAPVASDYMTVDGGYLDPTVRTQLEVGAKASLFGDRLTTNVSIYQYETDREPTPDLDNPGFYKNGPGAEGEGYEISVAGSVTRTLKVLAGFVHSTSQYAATTTPRTGVPENVANLWAIKTFNLGGDRSLDVGFGGNWNDSFHVLDYLTGEYHEIDRDYVSANASVAYTFGRYKINATVNNLFDRVNYFPSGHAGQILVDVPRSFRVNLSARF